MVRMQAMYMQGVRIFYAYHWFVECSPQLDLVTKQTGGLQDSGQGQGVGDMGG
jgi:hypothetical protein